MDKKLKLNAKMNFGMARLGFWNRVVHVLLRLTEYAHHKAKETYRDNQKTAGEMLKENYPEDFKEGLKEIYNEEI